MSENSASSPAAQLENMEIDTLHAYTHTSNTAFHSAFARATDTSALITKTENEITKTENEILKHQASHTVPSSLPWP